MEPSQLFAFQLLSEEQSAVLEFESQQRHYIVIKELDVFVLRTTVILLWMVLWLQNGNLLALYRGKFLAMDVLTDTVIDIQSAVRDVARCWHSRASSWAINGKM